MPVSFFPQIPRYLVNRSVYTRQEWHQERMLHTGPTTGSSHPVMTRLPAIWWALPSVQADNSRSNTGFCCSAMWWGRGPIQPPAVLHPFHSGGATSLHWDRHLFWTRICFLCLQDFCEHRIHGLMGCFILFLGIHINCFILNKSLHSQKSVAMNGFMPMNLLVLPLIPWSRRPEEGSLASLRFIYGSNWEITLWDTHSPIGCSVWLKPVTSRDFPGGPVVENPLGNAGDMGSIPGWGIKIPYATEQLSLCFMTTETICPRACVP